MDTLSTAVQSDGEDVAPDAAAPVLTDITDDLRSMADFDDHENVYHVEDAASGLNAFIALHDSTLGPSLGGCRMWPFATEEEAITDVLRLSRGMSYKAALSGVECGGGKSVIIGDSKTDKSEALFRAFGRAVDSFGGRYYSGEDVGVTMQDMDWAGQETNYVFGTDDRGGDPVPTTAYGVQVGIKAAARHRLGSEDLSGLTIAVQGLGHVGNELCALLRRDGASLVVSDMDPDAVLRAVLAYGAMPVEPDEIYGVEADVFAPCALGAVINDDTLPRLKCAIVAGSANNQLAQARHGEALQQNRILYAPDYVINAGGLIAFSLWLTPEGYSQERGDALTARIGGTLATIFKRADKENAPTNSVADRIAVELIRQGG